MRRSVGSFKNQCKIDKKNRIRNDKRETKVLITCEFFKGIFDKLVIQLSHKSTLDDIIYEIHYCFDHKFLNL